MTRVTPSTPISAFGITKTLLEWVEDPTWAVRPDMLVWRLRQGWEPERALSTPDDKQRRGSRFRGVTCEPSRGEWKAQIAVNGKVRNLGRFKGRSGEVLAAQAFDRAARELHGEDADVNFVV